ncbi:hypothetical protein Tco_1228512 [Tanacetum coccineum]
MATARNKEVIKAMASRQGAKMTSDLNSRENDKSLFSLKNVNYRGFLREKLEVADPLTTTKVFKTIEKLISYSINRATETSEEFGQKEFEGRNENGRLVAKTNVNHELRKNRVTYCDFKAYAPPIFTAGHKVSECPNVIQEKPLRSMRIEEEGEKN